MSSESTFIDLEETQDLLQDVLAFLDDNSFSDDATAPPASSSMGGDCVKMSRSRKYSPVYDRCRREKKKAERQALVSQVAQYETELELLRAQKSVPGTDSKWGWVHVATEEEKRRKAEEVNRQLRGIIALQLNAIKILHDYMSQEALFAQRVPSMMTQLSPSIGPITTGTFASLGAIAAHLKGMFGRLRSSADCVFSSASLAMEDPNSAGALMSSVNVKYEDPVAGPCIELLSTTPMSCSFKNAVSMLWGMLLDKKVLGSHAGCYTMKTKQLTERSAKFGYSTTFDASGVLDGVTLFEKYQEDNRAILLWASMLVDLQHGELYSISQGYLCVSRVSSNPQQQSVVRSSSRLSGKLFGVSAHVDVPVARKNQIASKARLERAQLRLVECAELQNGL
ncbi:hypothetical protein PI124_g18608 [Phytophthora idaei]|nr:hypothetical protein PI125_g22594 [Phytophthora idaei]KAG3236374.1 hypothetical protein PI124_g18608 [Phytophthora idaei]